MLREIEFKPKWYLNGFPKSGLHYAVQFIKPIADPMPDGQFRGKPWAGGFALNSWSEEMASLRQTMFWLGETKGGYYFKGHCGWVHDLQAFMWCLGLAQVFIYRDLRDVAVSQAYHIMSDRKELNHPGRDRFKKLGGFNEVLEAVILGLDEFPGVMQRWRNYAGWLEADWVYKFQYEKAKQNPRQTAQELVMYGLGRLAEIFGVEFEQPDITRLVDLMTESAQSTDSPTFRNGQPGEWSKCFTDRHKDSFKETDRDNWLIKLGYEQSQDW